MLSSRVERNDSSGLLTDKKILLMHALCRNQFQSYPDIGLGYLASSLIGNGVKRDSIKILCKNMASWTHKEFREFLREGRFDIVGIKTFSGFSKDTNATLEIIKETLPDALRLIGGPHPSCMLEKIYDDIPDAHFAFRGECEEALPEFLKAYYGRREDYYPAINGLIWREAGQVRVNDLALISDLGTFIGQDFVGMHKARHRKAVF